MFVCQSCGYECKRKSDLLRHIEGKRNTCSLNVASLEKMNQEARFQCRHGCPKEFKHEQSRFKHEKTCSSSNAEGTSTDVNTSTITQSNSILGGHHNSVTYNSVDNSIDNSRTEVNVTVNISSFDEFKPSRINRTKFVKYMMKGATTVILACLEEQQLNPSKPENMNVFISNLKDKIARVFDGARWKARNGDDVIEQVLENYVNMVNESISNFEDEDINAYAAGRIQRWEVNIDRDEFQDHIRKELLMTLYNIKDVVKEVHGVKQRMMKEPGHGKVSGGND